MLRQTLTPASTVAQPSPVPQGGVQVAPPDEEPLEELPELPVVEVAVDVEVAVEVDVAAENEVEVEVEVPPEFAVEVAPELVPLAVLLLPPTGAVEPHAAARRVDRSARRVMRARLPPLPGCVLPALTRLVARVRVRPFSGAEVFDDAIPGGGLRGTRRGRGVQTPGFARHG